MQKLKKQQFEACATTLKRGRKESGHSWQHKTPEPPKPPEGSSHRKNVITRIQFPGPKGEWNPAALSPIHTQKGLFLYSGPWAPKLDLYTSSSRFPFQCAAKRDEPSARPAERRDLQNRLTFRERRRRSQRQLIPTLGCYPGNRGLKGTRSSRRAARIPQIPFHLPAAVAHATVSHPGTGLRPTRRAAGAPSGTGSVGPHPPSRGDRVPLHGGIPLATGPTGRLSLPFGTDPTRPSPGFPGGRARTGRLGGRPAAPPGGPRGTPHAGSAHACARALRPGVPEVDRRWAGRVGAEKGHARRRRQVPSPP